jgi:hypothetical protein
MKPVPRAAGAAVLLILLAWLPAAAVFKASNEPLLSNTWMIYSEPEVQAVAFGVTHLENSTIWTGIDERIRNAYAINSDLDHTNTLRVSENLINTRHIILSEKDLLRAERTGFPLPPVFGWLQVYDNGEVQFYKKPPVTPFQR